MCGEMLRKPKKSNWPIRLKYIYLAVKTFTPLREGASLAMSHFLDVKY